MQVSQSLRLLKDASLLFSLSLPPLPTTNTIPIAHHHPTLSHHIYVSYTTGTLPRQPSNSVLSCELCSTPYPDSNHLTTAAYSHRPLIIFTMQTTWTTLVSVLFLVLPTIHPFQFAAGTACTGTGACTCKNLVHTSQLL